MPTTRARRVKRREFRTMFQFLCDHVALPASQPQQYAAWACRPENGAVCNSGRLTAVGCFVRQHTLDCCALRGAGVGAAAALAVIIHRLVAVARHVRDGPTALAPDADAAHAARRCTLMARVVGACVVHLDCSRTRAALCRRLRRGDGGGGALLAIDAGHVFDAVVCQAHAVRDAPLGAVDQELASEVLREYAQRLADLLALDDDAGARSPPALRLVHAHDEPIARAHLSSIDAIMLHATLEAARRLHRAFAVAGVAHRVFCRRRWCSLE